MDPEANEADAAIDLDDADENAFLANLLDKEVPAASSEAPTEAPEAPEGETTEEAEEGSQEAPEASTDPDDAEVDVKVGETATKAKLRDLKAAFAAQAEFTAKAQALETQTQTVAAQDARSGAALKAMMERATARFEPYAKLDMLVLSQRMDTDSFAALRADAAAAEADVKFLSQELDGHMQATNERAQVAYKEAAQACIRVLSDPKTGIEGFGKPLYDELISFADSHGIPAVRQMTDPAALKVVHMAMLHAKAQAAAKTATAKVAKVVNTPTRVMKPGTAPPPANRYKDALKALKSSGNPDDAEAAFLASFGDE